MSDEKPTDTEMLDWLGKSTDWKPNPDDYQVALKITKGYALLVPQSRAGDYEYPTVRAAIAAAMKEENDGC